MPRRPKVIMNFKPHNLEDLDSRFLAGKQVKQRYRTLKKQSGAISEAKDWLCKRAAYLSVMVESLEVEALTGKKVHIGNLLQATKTLNSILRDLGLEDTTAVPQRRLHTYLEGKATKPRNPNRHPRRSRAYELMAGGKRLANHHH